MKKINFRYSRVFYYPRKFIKGILILIYPLVIKVWKLPNIKSIEETIDKIIKDKASIARFGDGEIIYLIDKANLPFQKYDRRLAEYFCKLLISDKNNLLIGLPLGLKTLDLFEPEVKNFWKSQTSLYYPRFKKYLLKNKTYYNANITRLYYGFLDKNKSKSYFSKIQGIWNNRDIVLIEGEKSRLGVGNNLFENAKSIRRILAPAENSFSKFDEILNFVKQIEKESLILVALGPTAKAIVYELYHEGYQAVDIGNIDIEYEWFLSGTKERFKIKGKYTSEAKGGRIVEDIKDEKYLNQIMTKII